MEMKQSVIPLRKGKMPSNQHWFGAILMASSMMTLTNAQEETNTTNCYGSGTIALAVILSIIFSALFVLAAIYFLYKRRNNKDHLILETDPERGKEDYAFDNPGFKDATTISGKKSVLDNSFPNKWREWSPLSALSTKSEKRRALDDSALEKSEVKVVALRSHDFTGLGFNICGNIKEGIYIKDILHRGPAFESGKLNAGDKITSVTISFEHMVCEDALTILSYASPYEVIIEARSGKILHTDSSVGGGQPGHPVYRSSSCTNLNIGDKSDYSSLQKSKSTMPTLERNKSTNLIIPKKNPLKTISPKQLKTQLEQRIMPGDVEMQPQTTENKYQKFGVKVLLPLEQEKSPKLNELQQNDNNINIEKYTEQSNSIDERIMEEESRKCGAPPIKKREKKVEKCEEFVKSSLNSSIKRDKDGIPQEIPSHMFNAAVMAQRNRKNSVENGMDEIRAIKKQKGKAPPPPPEEKTTPMNNKKYDEIQSLSDESIDLQTPIKDYNSDSDMETDNHSSVNTIELNPNDITIHQAEDETRQNRKTASTGDLSKMQSTKSSMGTLERAQSLDITDAGTKSTSLKRKGDDHFDEDFGKVMQNKAPRLSLILDSLNTFERRTLKKSTEWGNLEDAILKLNHEENNHSPDILSDFGEKTPEFDAVVKKINEIRRESKENIEQSDVIVKNEIWPSEQQDEKTVETIVPERNTKYLSSITHIEDNTSNNNSIDEEISSSLVDEVMEELNEEKHTVKNMIWPTEQIEEPSSVIHDEQEIVVNTEENIEEDLKNSPDEVKEVVKPLDNIPGITETFLFNEKVHNHFDDTNVSDDIKVSRNSYESLERNNYLPKSDDAKSEDTFKNISNVTINNNGDTELHSLELSINESGDMYTTALDTPIQSTIRIASPKSHNDSPTLIGSENTSLTYITEIKVTPNISEIEIVPNLDSAFENYVRKFSNVEPTNNNFNIEEFIKEDDPPPQTVHLNSTEIDGEKEMHKIHELAEEQLKKLPEMKFVTQSYEHNAKPNNESKSHIELLRMNFERKSSLPMLVKQETPIKSRIPVAMSAIMTKSPPISPERRTSVENNENDKAIMELMSTNAMHSTPIVAPTMKYQQKPSPNKNITVTSIRNSKIPSGLPTLSGSRLMARKIELNDHESTDNGNVRSITNISLPESKLRKT